MNEVKNNPSVGPESSYPGKDINLDDDNNEVGIPVEPGTGGRILIEGSLDEILPPDFANMTAQEILKIRERTAMVAATYGDPSRPELPDPNVVNPPQSNGWFRNEAALAINMITADIRKLIAEIIMYTKEASIKGTERAFETAKATAKEKEKKAEFQANTQWAGVVSSGFSIGASTVQLVGSGVGARRADNIRKNIERPDGPATHTPTLEYVREADPNGKPLTPSFMKEADGITNQKDAAGNPIPRYFAQTEQEFNNAPAINKDYNGPHPSAKMVDESVLVNGRPTILTDQQVEDIKNRVVVNPHARLETNAEYAVRYAGLSPAERAGMEVPTPYNASKTQGAPIMEGGRIAQDAGVPRVKEIAKASQMPPEHLTKDTPHKLPDSENPRMRAEQEMRNKKIDQLIANEQSAQSVQSNTTSVTQAIGGIINTAGEIHKGKIGAEEGQKIGKSEGELAGLEAEAQIVNAWTGQVARQLSDAISELTELQRKLQEFHSGQSQAHQAASRG